MVDHGQHGVSWRVFERLAAAELAAPEEVTSWTADERTLFGGQMLRQEVASGGFDSYLRYSGAQSLSGAIEAAALLGPGWIELLREVEATLRETSPGDFDAREALLDELPEDLLDAWDARLLELEATSTADETFDAWVWSRRENFGAVAGTG